VGCVAPLMVEVEEEEEEEEEDCINSNTRSIGRKIVWVLGAVAVAVCVVFGGLVVQDLQNFFKPSTSIFLIKKSNR
jgi:hypothetical protein